jgi:hypothetical protein
MDGRPTSLQCSCLPPGELSADQEEHKSFARRRLHLGADVEAGGLGMPGPVSARRAWQLL